MCEGIRCDDDQNETIVERNVIVRNGGMGTAFTSKGINHIINNFVIDPTGFFQHRGIISLEGVPVDGSIVQRNILVAARPGLKPFYMKNLLINIIGDTHPQFSETKTDFNLYWHISDAKWADKHLAEARAQSAEEHSLVGDPLFRAPEKGDFRFKSGSPATKLGIEPIDLRTVGLRKK
jgi:hypothetical protein